MKKMNGIMNTIKSLEKFVLFKTTENEAKE